MKDHEAKFVQEVLDSLSKLVDKAIKEQGPFENHLKGNLIFFGLRAARQACLPMTQGSKRGQIEDGTKNLETAWFNIEGIE